MSVVHVEQLQKSFGSFVALKSIDLTVNKGEVFGFIGPNGAGKSVTIRTLLGIIRASSGQAHIFGKDVWTDAVDIHRRLAYVPGDVHLWPNLTGGEVIDLFGKLRGSIDRSKKEEMIERFSLDPKKKCRTYSKGNRQKVALVAAFSSNAELYILDEPTSGLDPLMEQVFQQCVQEIKDQGKSVLLSSHILSEVEKLCDRIGIIREGEIIETGTLKEMRHLTRIQMTVQADQSLTMLKNVPGIHDLANTDGQWTFQADNENLDEIIRFLAPLGVKKLESKPPALEDLFMRHYENQTRMDNSNV
ncbi:ABC transporter ATP-binding protein [Geomicrobium sediminis]|uniref:ABC-2 type transport system ATP-binding protein n=1 Tax=Geomicrobium sediminis TaxID=1347788 RepID=A0ABS2P8W9_9BACL|nr:ABC transporter ATP-binding protein [Geomicrobium sediminis]MBM7631848.1 ABC-2 type transport system ATP-binding protein [Geomicrobium sediminis]